MKAGLVGLVGFVRLAGVAIAGLGLAGCADDPGGEEDEDTSPPLVVSSSPAHLQTDIYPAPVFDISSPRVAISIRFSEPMDPQRREVRWGAVGGAPRAARGVWSEDRLELSFSIEAPPLTGELPLADLTTYRIELDGLRDLGGNAPQLSADSTESALQFTSGVYDPLLNHSCGHVAFGPFASLTAASAPGPLAPRSDAAHTRFTVTLPEVAGAPGTYAGHTRLRAPADATWHLFLDGDLPLTVRDLMDQALPVERRVTASACVGISHRASFALREMDQMILSIGPLSQPTAHFIVEHVAVEPP
jgi:hypothetical protein